MPGRRGFLFLIAAMALVFWVRTRPLSAPGVAERAEAVVRNEIALRLGVADSPLREGAVQEWIEKHRERFEHERGALAEQLAAHFRYEGEDGRSYVYLGDQDSYEWLRAARHHLRHGAPCGEREAVGCADSRDGTSPVKTSSRRSVHVLSLAALHRLITFFQPDRPLPATAMLLSALLATLGVVPAFFIARRFAGDLGGLFAALLVSSNLSYVARSLGGDNDPWNVVLPLFMIWFVVLALAARRSSAQMFWGALAALVGGLHGLTWRGWIFSFWVVVAGLVAACLTEAVGSALRREAVWRSAAVRRILRVVMVFIAGTSLFAALAGTQHSPWEMSSRVRKDFFPKPAGTPAVPDPGARLGPDVFATIQELREVGLQTFARSTGGDLFLLAALIGAVLLALPENKLGRPSAVWLTGTAALFTLLVLRDAGRPPTLALLVSSIAVAIAVRLFARNERPGGAQLITIIWFIGALYAAWAGIRYVIVLAVPLGLCAGVAFGRLATAAGAVLRARLAGRGPRPYWRDRTVEAVMLALAAALLFHPVRRSYETARRYLPQMSDAWWNALIRLRNETQRDAVVNTWWDYGYWVQYAAERQVAADGGSLNANILYWLGQAMIAPTDEESVGLLRLLNCGPDGDRTEAAHDVFESIRAREGDSLAAHEIVSAVARRDRAGAAAYLGARGYSRAQAERLLAATHCRPPPAYLIVSTDQMQIAAWLRIAAWDPQRAYIANRVRRSPPAEVSAELVRRFGVSEEQARKLDAQARAQPRHVFSTALTWYGSPRWHSCAAEGDRLRCPIGLTDAAGSRLEEVLYPETTPWNSRVRFRERGEDGSPGRLVEGTPAWIVSAGPRGRRDLRFEQASYPAVAVLVDLPSRRVLVGPPQLIRSTFVHLLYLDGRYAKLFEKFDEQISPAGDRVVTWKVKWRIED